MNNKHIKPPVGVIPERVYNDIVSKQISIHGGVSYKKILEDRVDALAGAINRYAQANLPIDMNWVSEYNKKLEILGIKQNKFKL